MKQAIHYIATLSLALLLSFVCTSPKAYSWGLVLRMGPASLGNGGANPLGMPPGGTDLEGSFITSRNWEFNVGIPGLLAGFRTVTKWGGYVSTGGGIAFDANGVGPALYTAFGYDFGWDVLKFNFEYKQALGITQSALISPYAVRFGVGLWF